MFNTNSIVSTVQSYAKSSLAFVPNKTVRENLEQIVDAQANFTKTATDAVTNILAATMKEAQNFDFSKLYAVPASK